MLGRFLEYSIATPDIRASFDFYVRLGFWEAAVGEAWAHPYAVLTDGRLCLGLHRDCAFVPSATFVKPDLLQYADHLEGLGLNFEFRHLGNDVFNEIGWLDPAGHLIRLVEARTFSPGNRTPKDLSSCGYFREIALPTDGREHAKAYWEKFGFVGIDAPDGVLPHVSCISDTIDIGLYDSAVLRAPTLRFELDDLGRTLAGLDTLGIAHDGPLPKPLRRESAALLTAPEGTLLLLSLAD